MTEDYTSGSDRRSEPYDFEEAVYYIWEEFHDNRGSVLAKTFPSWIRDNNPGDRLLVLSFETAADALTWAEYFGVRSHRSNPDWWAWGWHGWTVELTVLESGAGGLSEARPAVPVTDADIDAAVLRIAGLRSYEDLERGAFLASAMLDPDATLQIPVVVDYRTVTP